LTADSKKDQRRRPRVRLSCDVHMRPSLPGAHNFDEVLSSENCSCDGFYAATIYTGYKKHMGVFFTVPFSTAPGAINRDYVGEILRVDNLPDGRQGIAVRLLDPLSLDVHDGASANPGGPHYILRRPMSHQTA
jgi:hypothetical protein